MSVLSDRLKYARERKNLKQTQVKERTGINNKTLSGYENGVSEPDAETLAKLAETYDVSVDYLIGRTDVPRADNNGEMFFWDLDNVTQEEIEEAKRYIEFRRQQLNKRKHEDS